MDFLMFGSTEGIAMLFFLILFGDVGGEFAIPFST